MKLAVVVLHLIASAQVSSAFSPALQRTVSLQRSTYSRTNTRVFSQWDDEDEVAVPASFEEAGEGLKKADEDKKVDGMEDYDANPQYKASDIDRVRDAIKERTDALGIEKSKVTEDVIKQAQEKAQAAAADRGSGGNTDSGADFQQMLDLTQISQTAPRGQDDDQIPAMFYDPESEMSEEEKMEADPDGQLPIADQVKKELDAATWPTAFAAFKEVGLLIAIVVLTSGTIIFWDNFLRDFYTNMGFIPTPEDIMNGSENMVLPDGWTNNMSEEDFMKFQDEVAGAAQSATSSFNSVSGSFQDL